MNRPRWFASTRTRVTIEELINLDTRFPQIGQSLREMKMEIEFNEFWAVDIGHMGVTTFCFPQKYSSLASNYLADLGAFLSFKYGEHANHHGVIS